jgi:hypothetical protein
MKGRVKGWKGSFTRIDGIPSYDMLHNFAEVGFTNPLEVAWELVPFSFAADWFVPVGSWLSGLDALLGLTDLTYSSTDFLRYNKSLSGMPEVVYSDAGYIVRRNGAYTSSKERVYLNRLVGTSVPIPHPDFGSGLSKERLLNAIALLGQSVSG